MKIVLLLLLMLASTLVKAELRLGAHTDEPAPSIANILSEITVEGESVKVISYTNVDQLTQDLVSGELDLALIEEPSIAEPGVQVIGEVYPNVLHVLLQNNLSASGIGELLDSRYVWAGVSGGMGRRIAESLAEEHEVSAKWMNDPWSRTADVFFVFGGLLDRDAQRRLSNFRLWSLDEPENLMRGSVAEAVTLRYPNIRPFLLPGGLYPRLGGQPALTLSVSTLLVARSTLDLDRAYAIAEALEQARPPIAAAYPLAGLPQLDTSLTLSRTRSIHPGAQRFADRDMPSLLERYAEVMALMATLLVAGVSAVFAVSRRRRQRGKDQLDTYYMQVLEARQPAAATLADRDAARELIRGIQSQVFDLVVAERIDTNMALVAFLQLSNQLLLELEEHSG